MQVSFTTESERTDVLVGLRTLMRRFYEGDGGVANGIRITVLEAAIACVSATPIEAKP